MRFIRRTIPLCLLLFWIAETQAQPFSVSNAPIDINAKVDASIVRNGPNLELEATTTLTIGQIDALMQTFISQIRFHDCSTGARAGYKIENPRFMQSFQAQSLTLSADVTGCYRVPILNRVSDVNLTISIPVSLLMRGHYFALQATGTLDVSSKSWFADYIAGFLESVGRERLRQALARAIEKLNVAVLRTQLNSLESRGLMRFRPRIDEAPGLHRSFGGSLVFTLKLRGSIPTREVDAWLAGN